MCRLSYEQEGTASPLINRAEEHHTQVREEQARADEYLASPSMPNVIVVQQQQSMRSRSSMDGTFKWEAGATRIASS